ncbi:beta strand repeat-containing protein, partial [Novipirellula maiorica]|uniref:beta strand repeat-containing protein n=1 Tax=Novipirellula maiorica TaxID=1265734 RepID=UPI00191BDADF
MATLVTADISANTTWTAADSPYILQNNISITNGASLTIQDGVQVQATNSNITLNVGTGTQSGTLSSVSATAGGIDFETNVDVTSSGVAAITKSDFISGQLRINSGSNVTLIDNTFHGGADQATVPVWIDPSLTDKLDGNTFTTAGTYIGLFHGTISSPQTWKKLTNVDGYRLLDFNTNFNFDVNDDVIVNSTLTIEAGNTITRNSGQNSIIVNGTLNASGTAGAPVGIGLDVVAAAGSAVNFQQVDSGIGTLDLSGAATIQNTDFLGSSRLVVNNGSNVTLTGNTFHGGADQSSVPVWIDPSLTGKLDGNTFTTTGTYIGLFHGTISSPQTWKKRTNVDGYRLLDFNQNFNFDVNDDVIVNSTLTIEAGNTITRNSGQNSIIVNGTLNASGTVVSPVGIGLDVIAAAGSLVNFQQVDSGIGILDLSGAATIQNTDFLGSARLVVNDGSNVTLTGNTFHGGADQASIPVYIAPSLTGKLDGNTFTTAGTYVGLLGGTIATPLTWKKLRNVDGYRLLDFNTNFNGNVNDDVIVNSALTIEAGNTITRNSGQNTIIVNSTLQTVANRLETEVVFSPKSTGIIRENRIVSGATIRIDSDSTALFRDNTFLGQGASTVIGTGDTSKTIDLMGNFWGTTDIPTIESRIQDTSDPTVGSRPDIDVSNPVALNTISGTVWTEQSVDGIYDFTEPARAGVRVRLFDVGNDAAIGGGDDVQIGADQFTDSEGRYAFAGLVPTRHYYVEVVRPTNYGFTSPNVGNDFADSDVDSHGRTAVIQWIGAFDPSWDVGVYTNEFEIQATSAVSFENNSGTTPFTFTVTRDGLLTSSTAVNYAVTGSTINGANADDFSGGFLPSGTVTFAAGETSRLITIDVLGDTTVESDEGFIVTLNSPNDPGVIKTATAAGMIRNDDIDVSIEATSAEKLEGNTGDTSFTFTVTRNGLTNISSTVNYAVEGSAVNGATA